MICLFHGYVLGNIKYKSLINGYWVSYLIQTLLPARGIRKYYPQVFRYVDIESYYSNPSN